MSARHAHPRLEALEDRATPASAAATNAAISAVESQITLSRSVASLTNTVTVAPITPLADQIVAGPVVAQTGAPFRPDISALGFPGRIVFPGSGTQARVATGDGPLTQLPGIYLTSGSEVLFPDAGQLAVETVVPQLPLGGGTLDEAATPLD